MKSLLRGGLPNMPPPPLLPLRGLLWRVVRMSRFHRDRLPEEATEEAQSTLRLLPFRLLPLMLPPPPPSPTVAVAPLIAATRAAATTWLRGIEMREASGRPPALPLPLLGTILAGVVPLHPSLRNSSPLHVAALDCCGTGTARAATRS